MPGRFPSQQKCFSACIFNSTEVVKIFSRLIRQFEKVGTVSEMTYIIQAICIVIRAISVPVYA